MTSKRRILLLGGSGQVGRELQALPWADDIVLVAPSRAQLDLTKPGRVAEVLSMESWTAVINTAAWTDVDAAEANRTQAYAINAEAAAVIAEATCRRDVPMIHVSTDYVFDGSNTEPYTEEDSPRPLCVYGDSKLAGEEAIRVGNPRHLIVRTSWVFSQYGRNFVKTMLRAAETRDAVRVVADQRGTPTAAADLAGFLSHLATLEDLPDRAGTYHYANRDETTWYDFAVGIFEFSAALGGPRAAVEPINSSAYPTAATRPLNSRLSTLKIEREFGIRPRPWQAAVANCVRDIVGRAL